MNLILIHKYKHVWFHLQQIPQLLYARIHHLRVYLRHEFSVRIVLSMANLKDERQLNHLDHLFCCYQIENK